MATLDLPVTTVRLDSQGGSDHLTELADTDTSTYLTLTNGFDGLLVDAYEAIPGDITPTEIRYVVIARATSITLPFPGAWGTIPEPETAPFLQMDNQSSSDFYALDYLSAKPTFAESVSRFTVDAGDFDLKRIFTRPLSAGAVDIAYLAKRITYDAPAGVPPLRIGQRMDGLTGGAPRVRGAEAAGVSPRRLRQRSW